MIGPLAFLPTVWTRGLMAVAAYCAVAWAVGLALAAVDLWGERRGRG